MKKMTIDEWRAEGERLFGSNPYDLKFVCPKCGQVSSGNDFKELGVEDAVNAMYVDCIGRHTKEKGCNWAAYGLFGTLGKGIQVGEKEQEVFSFYYSEGEKEE